MDWESINLMRLGKKWKIRKKREEIEESNTVIQLI